MFDRECRQRHATFLRTKLNSIALTLSSHTLDAKVVGDPELIAKLEKLTDDTVRSNRK